ncbi:hypothetical protein B7G68_07595 [Caulobacter segnis]|uniref:Uncharacterized protein n=2 Tax=Caulobacter segnis TaxID=88688 RepID=D5VFW7_CAUST|nr:hypothetical protein [Caulobacter segnis]ADG09970.1 conserved hypothetical protein [Caulobacter segnis ATCC 21756]AVQ01724.1 hypothetical protein B7G68_07595 [Caulobacter segnis]
MRKRLALLAALAVGTSGGGAQASTADTQARLAAARPVATQAVTPPPPPVAPHKASGSREPMAAPPKTNLAAPEAPPPRAAPPRELGLILLAPALIALVAVVRWFARRRRSGSKRV